ncbi:hypothetical protein [Nocardioides pacificus]
MKVRDSRGRVWRVSRRWLPWRRRGDFSDSADGLELLDADADDPIGCVIWLVGLVLVVPTLLLVAIGLAFSIIELALLVVLLPFAVFGRILFGRHWHVEVRHGFERIWETDAGNWGASREAIAANAELLRRDEHPAQRLVPEPAPAGRPAGRRAGPGGRHARRDRPRGEDA